MTTLPEHSHAFEHLADLSAPDLYKVLLQRSIELTPGHFNILENKDTGLNLEGLLQNIDKSTNKSFLLSGVFEEPTELVGQQEERTNSLQYKERYQQFFERFDQVMRALVGELRNDLNTVVETSAYLSEVKAGTKQVKDPKSIAEVIKELKTICEKVKLLDENIAILLVVMRPFMHLMKEADAIDLLKKNTRDYEDLSGQLGAALPDATALAFDEELAKKAGLRA